MHLFVLARDAAGLRAVAVHPEIDPAESDVADFRSRGFETTVVTGFGLEDVMASHPAWFRIEAAA